MKELPNFNFFIQEINKDGNIHKVLQDEKCYVLFNLDINIFILSENHTHISINNKIFKNL